MVERDYCASPTLTDYSFAHRRHRGNRGQGLRAATSSDSLHKSQLLDVPGISKSPEVLHLGPPRNRGITYRGSFSQEDVRGPPGNVPGYVRATGLRLVGDGVMDSYHFGDSLSHISPTPYTFAGRRRPALPELGNLLRKGSSTTTFSDDDEFQISYHKVQDSPVASWQGDEEGSEGSRRNPVPVQNRIPSVELPSLLRGTRRSRSEQLTRSTADVMLPRLRSERLRRGAGSSPDGKIDVSVLQSSFQDRPRLQPSPWRNGVEAAPQIESFCLPPAKQRTWSNLERHNRSVEQQQRPASTSPRIQTGPGDIEPLNLEAVRYRPLSLTPHHMPSNSESNMSESPSRAPSSRNTPCTDFPIEIRNDPGDLDENASVLFSPSSSSSATDSNRDVRENVSLPRKVTIREDAASVSIMTDDVADVDQEAQSSNLEVANTGPSIPASGIRLDKAVQVHIRKSDKRLVACTVLCGVMAVALVAVVLFAILDK
ncbi:unnamed protein product [Ixodes hexagonus]